MEEDFRRGMAKFDAILQGWKNTSADSKKHYHKLYSAITNFDKQIERRYDRLSGSTYLFTLAAQIGEQLIDVSELDALTPWPKNAVLFLVNGDEE